MKSIFPEWQRRLVRTKPTPSGLAAASHALCSHLQGLFSGCPRPQDNFCARCCLGWWCPSPPGRLLVLPNWGWVSPPSLFSKLKTNQKGYHLTCWVAPSATLQTSLRAVLITLKFWVADSSSGLSFPSPDPIPFPLALTIWKDPGKKGGKAWRVARDGLWEQPQEPLARSHISEWPVWFP